MAEEYFDHSVSEPWDHHFSPTFSTTFLTVVLAEQAQVCALTIASAAHPSHRQTGRPDSQPPAQACLLPPDMRRRKRRTLRADPYGGGAAAEDAIRHVNAA